MPVSARGPKFCDPGVVPQVPADNRLLDLPIVRVFGLPTPLPKVIASALRSVDEEALAAGRAGWYVSRVNGEPWVLSTEVPSPAMEVDLAVRPVPMPGWADVWQASIDLGVDCECPVDHNMHYVRRLAAQAAIHELAPAVRHLIATASEWAAPGRDAAWWRGEAGLPSPKL